MYTTVLRVVFNKLKIRKKLISCSIHPSNSEVRVRRAAQYCLMRIIILFDGGGCWGVGCVRGDICVTPVRGNYERGKWHNIDPILHNQYQNILTRAELPLTSDLVIPTRVPHTSHLSLTGLSTEIITTRQQVSSEWSCSLVSERRVCGWWVVRISS